MMVHLENFGTPFLRQKRNIATIGHITTRTNTGFSRNPNVVRVSAATYNRRPSSSTSVSPNLGNGNGNENGNGNDIPNRQV